MPDTVGEQIPMMETDVTSSLLTGEPELSEAARCLNSSTGPESPVFAQLTDQEEISGS
jgi:hypothetical protein